MNVISAPTALNTVLVVLTEAPAVPCSNDSANRAVVTGGVPEVVPGNVVADG